MPPSFRESVVRIRPRHLLFTLILVFPLALLYAFYSREPLGFTRISLGPVNGPTPPVSPAPLSIDIPRVLLISAFYPLATSKHPIHEYKRWLSLFLGRITTDIYFFTHPEWEPWIREIRGELPIIINTTFLSPFDIPPLQGRRQEYEEMHSQDREAYRHSPELYAVWNAKTYFLREGLRNSHAQLQLRNQTNNDGYKYAFWADAGNFRHDNFWIHWPDPARVEAVWAEGARETGMKAEEIILFPIEGLPHSSMKFWREDMGPIDNSVSEGSFFGGMPTAIDWWYNLYFSYHDRWLDEHIFVGKDQTIYNALFMIYPSHFICVWFSDPIAPAAVSLLSSSPSFSSYDIYHPPPRTQLASPLGQCLSIWYYYIFFLGSEAERETTIKHWLSAWQWMWPWEWIQQLRVKKARCRLTGVLAMESVLKRAFGEDWSSPTLSIDRT